MTNRPIKILVADDHAVVRQGFRRILEAQQDLQVVGEAANGREAIRLAQELRPDLVLLDVSMPELNGVEATRRLKESSQYVKVLVLSMMPEQEVAVRLLMAGADGFISKQSAVEEVVDAVRKLAKGRKHISEKVAEQLADNIGSDPTALPHEKLSDREFQVVQLIAEGRSTREIAEELNLSSNTVATYRRRILEKLNLRTDVDVTRYAIKHQIVD